jgi:hypothetical protein
VTKRSSTRSGGATDDQLDIYDWYNHACETTPSPSTVKFHRGRCLTHVGGEGPFGSGTVRDHSSHGFIGRSDAGAAVSDEVMKGTFSDGASDLKKLMDSWEFPKLRGVTPPSARPEPDELLWPGAITEVRLHR